VTNSVISSITPRSCPSRSFAIHHNRIKDAMYNTINTNIVKDLEGCDGSLEAGRLQNMQGP